ncbi:MAG TPA: DUF885 domain-containing protein [Acidimicrobiia bacterium]
MKEHTPLSLSELADRFWLATSEYRPTIATVRGEHRFDDQLPLYNEDWLGRMGEEFRAIRDLTEAVGPEGLDLQDRITRDLLIHESRVWADEIEDRFMVAPVDPYLGAHTRLLSDTQQNTVTDVEQAEALLSRYARVGTYLASALALIRGSAAQGMTPPRAALERVVGQLDAYLASSLDTDPFLELELPPGADQRGWRDRAEGLVADVIKPAIATYRHGLVEQVEPLARPPEHSGLRWMTDGETIYGHLIHKYTQLDRSPEEIHRIGVEWATEILATEWETIGERALGLSSMTAIFDRLHGDPSFRFVTEEEMLDHGRATVARAWEAVDDWFGARPETPCQVVPVPAAMAPAMPPAYYMQPPPDRSREGTYFLNTYKPEERDRFEYESIHFHEAIPGHHFDRSLASELDGIPMFRRYTQVYAHTEGWGLYAERLADEMGLYSSDVDRLGMLSADGWRAGRLVVDTGIHALGWTRDQAINWLLKWTPIGRLTVEQEVDRYIGMPGQALSYKMGQLEIMRLRSEAERRLGPGFDIKGFHDTLLTSGAMTLPLLADVVESWIENAA